MWTIMACIIYYSFFSFHNFWGPWKISCSILGTRNPLIDLDLPSSTSSPHILLPLHRFSAICWCNVHLKPILWWWTVQEYVEAKYHGLNGQIYILLPSIHPNFDWHWKFDDGKAVLCSTWWIGTLSCNNDINSEVWGCVSIPEREVACFLTQPIRIKCTMR